MSHQETQRIHLMRPVHYELPSDLVFEGLAQPKGTECVRLLFSRGRGEKVSVPLSDEALEFLVQEIGLLHRTPAHEMRKALADLHSKGLQIRK